jgi:hypothetical protein
MNNESGYESREPKIKLETLRLDGDQSNTLLFALDWIGKDSDVADRLRGAMAQSITKIEGENLRSVFLSGRQGLREIVTLNLGRVLGDTSAPEEIRKKSRALLETMTKPRT